MRVLWLALALAVALPVAAAVACKECFGQDCDTGSCTGDYCFVSDIFRLRIVKGCGFGFMPGEADGSHCIWIGDVPVYCQCNEDACNAAPKELRQEKGSIRKCFCEGDHCDERSNGTCVGMFCWEMRNLPEPFDRERTPFIRGCSDQVGLIPGRFGMSPPAVGVFDYSIPYIDGAEVYFCNNADYCDFQKDAKLGSPVVKVDAHFRFGHLEMHSKGQIYLREGEGAPWFKKMQLLGPDNHEVEINYDFDEDRMEPFRIPEPETTTEAEQETTEVPVDHTGNPVKAVVVGHLEKPSAKKAEEPEEGSSNGAIIAVFVVLIVVILVVGLAWKCELHKKIFAARYQSVA